MPRWPRCCIWASLPHLAAFSGHRILRRGWRRAERKPIFVAALGLWLSWDAFFVSETCPRWPRCCICASLPHLAAFSGHRILRRGWRRAERKPIFVAALGLWLSWDAFFVSETCRVGRAVVSAPACRIWPHSRVHRILRRGWRRAERKPIFVAALGLWLSWDAFFVSETCRVGRAVVSGPACRIWPHFRVIGYSEEDGGGLRGSPCP